ncbi:MAG: hypothetical protein ACRD3J_04375 [Thermoanaerobaculia bacterium]
MPNDFEQLLKEIFGEPIDRLSRFSSEQTQKLQARLQEFAREAVKDELAKLHAEVADLRVRVAELEKERVEDAADAV